MKSHIIDYDSLCDTERYKEVSQKITLKAESIEARINFLKSKIQNIQSQYVLDLYECLKEILILRKSQMKRYSLFDLSQEKGLNFKVLHLRYIFKLDFISPATKKLIEARKIRATAVIRILYKSAVFCKDFKKQDLLIQAYLKGKITITDIAKFPLNSLLTYINTDSKGENHMSKKDKVILNSVYQMRQITNTLDKNRALIKKEKPEELRDSFNNLSKVVGDTLDNGNSICYKCPNCKKKIKLTDMELWKDE